MTPDEFIEIANEMAGHLKKFRAEVIEECARVADAYLSNIGLKGKGRDVANAIRALKDKP